jgi:hypothetical protein
MYISFHYFLLRLFLYRSIYRSISISITFSSSSVVPGHPVPCQNLAPPDLPPIPVTGSPVRVAAMRLELATTTPSRTLPPAPALRIASRKRDHYRPLARCQPADRQLLSQRAAASWAVVDSSGAAVSLQAALNPRQFLGVRASGSFHAGQSQAHLCIDKMSEGAAHDVHRVGDEVLRNG